MQRHAMVSTIAISLASCTVSNTGNPNSDRHSHPDGVELLRSELGANSMPAVSEQSLATFAETQRTFAFNVYATLASTDSDIVFSPYSIATALAMTYAGARGETKEQMAAALHFELPEPEIHKAFNATNLALLRRPNETGDNGGDGFTLRVTSGIFAQRGYEVNASYLDVLAENYDAGLFLADFSASSDPSRTAINDWVSARSERRIEGLLPPNSISALTRLVLLNAIFFKASWLHKFDRRLTRSLPFHSRSGDVSAQMMHGTVNARFSQGDSYQAVELPYVSTAVRMLLLLPDEGRLAEVEAGLTSGLFNQARDGLTEYEVELVLPRFTFRQSQRLSDILRSLGMDRAFGDAADLSGIAGVPGQLYVDDVYHEAFIAVDEEGTEAAAATAVVINDESASPRVDVRFDREFLFFVYDEPTGMLLFAGRFSGP